MQMPERISVNGANFTIARAEEIDLHEIVKLLKDDPLGTQRESSNHEDYVAAFREIDTDPNQFLAVVKEPTGRVVGTLQLTFVPGLSRGGATRMLIEAVRIAAGQRGSGLGAAAFDWAHNHARGRGVALVQLTTDRSRTDAHRFYERLGYAPTHVGYKLDLSPNP